MYKIGILSRPGKVLNCIHSEIVKSPFFKVDIYIDSSHFVRALKANKLDALVMITEEFRPNHVQIIREVKKYFPKTPVVVMTEKCERSYKISLVDFRKTILLSFQEEAKDINGILFKLIHNLHVIPRLASRYTTEQMARISIDNEKTSAAWIVNLAQDGACFRIFNHKFQKGHHVRIEVPLADLKKTHVLRGKIVWEKIERLKNHKASNSQMIGIQFLGA